MEAEYRRLKSEWESGTRDRESALRLIYLAWMHWADPEFVTGMQPDPDDGRIWLEVFDYLGGDEARDAEFLHIASYMAGFIPEPSGSYEEWRSRAKAMKARSLCLNPEGFPPEFFEGRGEYGEYFAHHARQSKYYEAMESWANLPWWRRLFTRVPTDMPQ